MARRTRTQTVRAPAGVEIGDGPTPAGVPAVGLVVHIVGEHATVYRNGEYLCEADGPSPSSMLTALAVKLAAVAWQDELERVLAPDGELERLLVSRRRRR